MFEDFHHDEATMHSGSASRSGGEEQSNELLFGFHSNVKLPFPIKLHTLLEDMANRNSQDVVSWQPHGKAFRVHQPEVFARTIMGHYFNQTHYKSFQRQLHIYGFRRIKKGKDMGGYYSSLFVRNKRSMSLRMVREKVKGTSGKNRGREEIDAPDFYNEMVIMEDQHLPWPHYSENREDFAIMAKPLPILGDFSGLVTAKNTYRGGGGHLDPWLDLGEQKVSSFSLKKKNSFCNDLQSFLAGNDVARSVVVKEQIEDGDEVFFAGKRFHFLGTSEPKTPALVDFLAAVTAARGPDGCMPKGRIVNYEDDISILPERLQ